jgi:hypothetical protein
MKAAAPTAAVLFFLAACTRGQQADASDEYYATTDTEQQQQYQQPQNQQQHFASELPPHPFSNPTSEGSSSSGGGGADVNIPLNLNLNLSMVRYHAGEAAVGASAGAVAAWLIHRLQSTAMLLGVLGSVGTAAALHLQWVSPEQVRAVANAALRMLQAKLAQLLRIADVDEDGEITVEDSRIAYSKVAPLVRRHTALTGGLVGGFVTAYSALR